MARHEWVAAVSEGFGEQIFRPGLPVERIPRMRGGLMMLAISLAILLTTQVGQAQYVQYVYQQQPIAPAVVEAPWVPVRVAPLTQTTVSQKPGDATAVPANSVGAQTGAAPTKPGWPYYSESPLYQRQATVMTPAPQQMMIVQPQQPPYVIQPAAPMAPFHQAPAMLPPAQTFAGNQPPISPARQIVPPAQSPAPVSSPAATNAATAARQPMVPTPATNPAPVAAAQQQPINPQPPAAPAQRAVQPNAQAAAPVPPQQPAVQPAPIARPNAPFVDRTVVSSGGHAWTEYDISEYTARFPAEVVPERGVQKWILRKVDPAAWHGIDPSSLVVTPQRVKLYHDPEVRNQIEWVLGRILNDSLREFQCQVHVLNVKDLNWRSEYLSRLQVADSSQPGRQAWFINREDTSRFVGLLSDGSDGLLLANPQFTMANGQDAVVRWASENNYVRDVSLASNTGDPTSVGYRQQTQQVNDGVTVTISPLIGRDFASTELDVDIQVTKLASREEIKLKRPGKPKVEVPEVSTVAMKDRFMVPPGKNVLLSLGLVPSFDNHKSFWRREHKAELLVLIEIAPKENGVPPNGAPPGSVIAQSAKPADGGMTAQQQPRRRGIFAPFHGAFANSLPLWR